MFVFTWPAVREGCNSLPPTGSPLVPRGLFLSAWFVCSGPVFLGWSTPHRQPKIGQRVDGLGRSPCEVASRDDIGNNGSVYQKINDIKLDSKSNQTYHHIKFIAIVVLLILFLILIVMIWCSCHHHPRHHHQHLCQHHYCNHGNGPRTMVQQNLAYCFFEATQYLDKTYCLPSALSTKIERLTPKSSYSKP